MAKIIRKPKAKAEKENAAAEEKMRKTQAAKLREEDDDDDSDEQASKTARDNKRGVAIVNKHKIKTFSAAREEEREEDDDLLVESRPKTSADQQRVLKRDSNPQHTALVESARMKMTAVDNGEEADELTDDEIDAYLAEEKKNLKHYGKVKLTPEKLNTTKPAIQKAAAGSTSAEDRVKVTMFETVDPAPQVGTCNVVRDIGYEKLVKGETYLLPKTVAMVLAEGKKGAIHD